MLALLTPAWCLAAACGGAPPARDVPATFPVTAIAQVTSDSGALHIELRSAPEPLVRGQNVGQVTVTDGDGQPVDGLALAVTPWMPLHGHGTSADPVIFPTDTGVFVANPLYLFMAGEWQLRMTFDGEMHDTAMAIVDIP